jgi:hypothetical protein
MFNLGIKQKPRCGKDGMMDSSKEDHWRQEYLYILKASLSTLLNSFKENNKSFS